MTRFLHKFVVLVCLTFLIYSCTDSERSIKYNIDEGAVETLFTDTITVRTSVYLEDSVVTLNPLHSLSGKIELPHVKAQAHSYVNVAFSAGTKSQISVSSEAEYDSLVLILRQEYVYGDTTKRHGVRMQKLSQTLGTGTYYHFDELQAENEILAKGNFLPRTSDINVRIRASDVLGRALMKQAQAGGLNYADLLKELPAIKISSTDDTKNMVGFDLPSSKLQLYHHKTSGTVTTQGSATLYFFRRFSHIDRDLTVGVLSGLKESQAISTDQFNNVCYVQQGIGLFLKLDFPYLKDFEKGNTIVINKAQLVLSPIDPPATLKSFLPPGALFFNKSTQAGTPVILSRTLKTTYSSNAGEYSPLDLTGLVESLVKKKKNLSVEFGLFLTPQNSFSKNSFLYDKINFVRIGDNNHAEKKMRLRLFYTKYKE